MRRLYNFILFFILETPAFSQAPLYPEVPATFKKGGEVGFYNMISKNMKYPAKSMENCVQGRISVQFLITKDGRIDSISCINHLDKDIDAEVIRVIKLSDKKWEPAILNGKVVDTRLIIPLTFNTQREVCNNKIQRHISEGTSSFNSGQFNRAIEEFSRTLKYDPSNTQALNYIGMSYFKLNNLDSACSTWNQSRYIFDSNGTKLYNEYCGNRVQHGL